jgi:HrpA-like RNA helicase
MDIVNSIAKDKQTVHIVRGDMGTGKTTQIAQLLQKTISVPIYLIYPSRLLAS